MPLRKLRSAGPCELLDPTNLLTLLYLRNHQTMQQPLYEKQAPPTKFSGRILPLMLPFVLAQTIVITGCGDGPDTNPSPKGKFAGIALTIRCADPAFVSAITPAVHSWADRSGASVALHT